MENEENKKGAVQGNDHPKPTDDVQLEIETVIPSTEKETDKPGEPAHKPEELRERKKQNSMIRRKKQTLQSNLLKKTKLIRMINGTILKPLRQAPKLILVKPILQLK